MGLTVLSEIALNSEEEDILSSLKANISLDDINIFSKKLQKLVDKSNTQELIIHSNPYFLYETNEFKDILNYCNNKGEAVWPMLFENIFNDKNPDAKDLSILLINEITPEYAHLMEEVKDEWSNNNYTTEGAYIAPSPVSNTKNYVKKLLVSKSDEGIPSLDNKTFKDNHDLFSVYPNPFKYQTNVKFSVTDNNSTISLKVFDLKGRLQDVVINNQLYNAGNYQVVWITENLNSGLYLFSLSIDGKTSNRRFLIEK